MPAGNKSRENRPQTGLRLGSIAILILFSAAVRTGVCLKVDNGTLGFRASLLQDTDAYLRLAGNLSRTGIYGFEDAKGQVTPTAFRPPLLPWIYSWFARPKGSLGESVENQSAWVVPAAGVAITNIFLGVLTSVLIALITVRIVNNRFGAVLAGVMMTIDPILLRAGQSAMTELLATFLLVLAWWLWMHIFDIPPANGAPRRTAQRLAGLLALGCIFGFSVLARPTAAPIVAICVLILCVAGDSSWKVRFGQSLVVSTVVAAILAPWVLRNQSELGKPIWATTHGGYTLLLANNPQLYKHMRQNGPSRDWDAEPFHAAWVARDVARLSSNPGKVRDALTGGADELAELKDDHFATEIARENIRSHPDTFLLSCCYRFMWLWAPWPNQGSLLTQAAIGIWYFALYGASLLGLCRLKRARREPAARRQRRFEWCAWTVPVATIVCLSGVHAIYWSNMRMRAPILPALYVVTAVAAFGPRMKPWSPTDHPVTQE